MCIYVLNLHYKVFALTFCSFPKCKPGCIRNDTLVYKSIMDVYLTTPPLNWTVVLSVTPETICFVRVCLHYPPAQHWGNCKSWESFFNVESCVSFYCCGADSPGLCERPWSFDCKRETQTRFHVRSNESQGPAEAAKQSTANDEIGHNEDGGGEK